MSLDALTKDELAALVEYNLEQISNLRYKGKINGQEWAPLRAKIMKAVDRIDRIVALGKGVA